MLCDYPCKACGVERLLTEADRIRQLYGLSSRWLDGEWTHNGQDDGCPLAERPVESVEEKEVVEKEAVIYVLEGKKVTGLTFVEGQTFELTAPGNPDQIEWASQTSANMNGSEIAKMK